MRDFLPSVRLGGSWKNSPSFFISFGRAFQVVHCIFYKAFQLVHCIFGMWTDKTFVSVRIISWILSMKFGVIKASTLLAVFSAFLFFLPLADFLVTLTPRSCFWHLKFLMTMTPRSCFWHLRTLVRMTPKSCLWHLRTLVTMKPRSCFWHLRTLVTMTPRSWFWHLRIWWQSYLGLVFDKTSVLFLTLEDFGDISVLFLTHVDFGDNET